MANTENNNEKHSFDVVATAYDELDNGGIIRIRIDGWSDELDDGGNLTINLMKYDQVANKFVDDAATREEADKTLTEMFGVGVDDIIADTSVIQHASFDGYFNAENSRIYLTQARSFQNFDKLDAAGERAIRNLEMPTQSTPIGESKIHGISKRGEPFSIYRFETGIEVDVKGETKCYRIAQFKVESPDEDAEPVLVRLNYADKTADEKFHACDTGQFSDPEDARKNLTIAEKMTERSRARVVGNFNQATGLDLEQLIANGEGVTIERVEVFPSGFGSYLVATVSNGLPF